MIARGSFAAGTTGRLEWGIAPWVQPAWYAFLAWCWWRAGAAEAVRPEQSPLPAWASAIAPALIVTGKLAGFLIETSLYRLLWRGRGRSLPFWRFFCVVASASMADVLALQVAGIAHRGPAGLAAWLAPVAGAHLAGGWVAGWSPALRAAFGTAGLLTALRLGLTAHAQRQALGIPMRSALTWTALVWLATRIALLFAVDLMRGMSPLPVR
jgi:hypothetical protein